MLITWLLLSTVSMANEPIHPRADILRRGYIEVPAAQARSAEPALPFAAHSLPWPVAFKDARHSMGNTMAQFQPFGDPYWHGGCDLRVARRAPITAPVAGWVEAGHYDYATRPDGTLQKFWKAWPETGEATYFEVAIVTDEGCRFELHHVDRSSLTAPVLDALNRGGGRIAAGEPVGRAIAWVGMDYDHVHYNIITPTDIRVNPEHASPLLPDTLAPRVLDAWMATAGSPTVHPFASGLPSVWGVHTFYLRVAEQKDSNIYVAPPALAELAFDSGEKTTWDFRERLMTELGIAPELLGFYARSIRTTEGQTLRTEGGYGTGPVIVRLPVPTGAKGAFKIRLADPAGNETLLTGTLL